MRERETETAAHRDRETGRDRTITTAGTISLE